MSGTLAGGKKAAETNKKKYGDDFYKVQGAKGGAASGTGGFYYMKVNGMDDEIAEAGRKGGRISKRTKKATDSSPDAQVTKHRMTWRVVRRK